jgi:hypothetical protein
MSHENVVHFSSSAIKESKDKKFLNKKKIIFFIRNLKTPHKDDVRILREAKTAGEMEEVFIKIEKSICS